MLITIYNTCYMDRWIDKYIGIYWYILSLDILVLLSWNDNENYRSAGEFNSHHLGNFCSLTSNSY